jgi:hypothetical protein
MKKETEDKIVSEFPEYFPNFRGNPSETCLAWGLAIGEGWAEMFHQLCRDIKLANPDKFHFEQVKEKFGGLRAYFIGGNEVVSKLIDQAESDSYKICERCGTKDNVSSSGSWIVTLCEACRKGLQS